MRDIVIDKRMNKNGTFSYQCRFEIASVDGKRKWKTKSGFTTKKEAKEAAKLAQQAYEQVGQVVEPSDMSYADFLDRWLENCALDCVESTIKGYEKKIRLLNRNWGLIDLNPLQKIIYKISLQKCLMTDFLKILYHL